MPIALPKDATVDERLGMVRVSIVLPHPAARVFEALKGSAQPSAREMGDDVLRYGAATPRPGDAWSLRACQGGVADVMADGRLLIVDSPRVLACLCHTPCDGYQPTVVRFELRPVNASADNGVQLTITHTGFVGRPDAARAQAERWARLLSTWAGRAFGVDQPTPDAVGVELRSTASGE